MTRLIGSCEDAKGQQSGQVSKCFLTHIHVFLVSRQNATFSCVDNTANSILEPAPE